MLTQCSQDGPACSQANITASIHIEQLSRSSKCLLCPLCTTYDPGSTIICRIRRQSWRQTSQSALDTRTLRLLFDCVFSCFVRPCACYGCLLSGYACERVYRNWIGVTRRKMRPSDLLAGRSQISRPLPMHTHV